MKNMLEIGNCCYIDNDYKKLWLIIGIDNNLIMIRNKNKIEVIR